MLKFISIAALLAALLASILVFTGELSNASYKAVMNIVTVLWFVMAPLWMAPELLGRKKPEN